ncbi:MAG: pilus assembly FimT family protein, partial [Blastocatellia bacterium]
MNKNQRNTNKRTDPGKRNERGYALIGLMAVMMFAMILTTAAAPTLRQEMQREKEEEMLWRGQQVAFAIKRYRDIPGRNRAFPTDLSELVKGIDLGGKKIHLLRPSAMCDPMTPCAGETNWRMVHPGDPLPKELLDGILETQEKSPMTVNPQGIMELTRFAQMGSVKLPGQPADTQLDGVIGPTDNQGADSGSDDKTKKLPIIGVVSRKSD